MKHGFIPGPISAVFSETPHGAAVKAAVTELQARLPKQFRQTGTAESGIAADRVVCQLGVPSQPIAGKVIVQSLTQISQSLSTDQFGYRLYCWTSSAGTQYLSQLSPAGTQCGSFDLAAGDGCVVAVQVGRSTGSGTASTAAEYQSNHIDALWVPNAP